MIDIVERIQPPLGSNNITTLNKYIIQPLDKNNISNLNNLYKKKYSQPQSTQQSQPTRMHQSQTVRSQQSQPTKVQQLSSKPKPNIINKLQKGQKVQLPATNKVKICFGWNINDKRCDVDISAFMVKVDKKVPSDDWFVFYNQRISPDGSLSLIDNKDSKDDLIKQIMNVNLTKLKSSSMIQRIVFALTINEAIKNSLNFSMLSDIFIKVIDSNTDKELFGFILNEYYSNVTSMTLGELYLHNGVWKFNPIGNGLHCDLAEQCAVYGVNLG